MYLLWVWNDSFKLSSECVTASGSAANKEIKQKSKGSWAYVVLKNWTHCFPSCHYELLTKESAPIIFNCLFTTYALEPQRTSEFKAYKKLNAPIILNSVCSVLLEPVHSFSLGIFILFAGGRKKSFLLVLRIGSWSNSIIVEWFSSLWADSQCIINQD